MEDWTKLQLVHLLWDEVLFSLFFSRKSKQDHFVSAEFATALTLHNSKTQFLRLIILIFLLLVLKLIFFFLVDA